MRIEKPRTDNMVEVAGRMCYRVGFVQMHMLTLISILDRGEAPPKGLLKGDGTMREHTANDMVPTGFLNVHRVRDGFTNYWLTAKGKETLKHGVVVPPRNAKQRREDARLRREIRLLARQKARNTRQASRRAEPQHAAA